MRTVLKITSICVLALITYAGITAFSAPPAPMLAPDLAPIQFTNNAHCDVSVVAVWSTSCPCRNEQQQICTGMVPMTTTIGLPTSSMGYDVLCALKVTCDASCNTGSGLFWLCQGGGPLTGSCGDCNFTLSGSAAAGFTLS
jgi:hypothetical protein